MSAYPAPASWRRRLLVALGVVALAILAFTFGGLPGQVSPGASSA